ncbi:MAG TPA: DNA gyrase subunit A [Motilibacteraceae bacterium]|nr:DNA gyrase subunit A [Motilibacteraceae bacterium]
MGDDEQPTAQWRLEKARQREHILSPIAMAAVRWREVLLAAAEAQDLEHAAARLRAELGLDEHQAQAVLSLQVRRLPAAERAKIERELAELRTEIAELERELAESPD